MKNVSIVNFIEFIFKTRLSLYLIVDICIRSRSSIIKLTCLVLTSSYLPKRIAILFYRLNNELSFFSVILCKILNEIMVK